MPLEFDRPISAPTLGRRRRLSPAERRERFPRPELVAGLRMQGGWCSTMGERLSEAFVPKMIAKYSYEMARRGQVQNMDRPVDAGAIYSADIEITEGLDFHPLTNDELGRLVDSWLSGRAEEFTRNNGMFPQIETSRDTQLMGWRVRVHHGQYYCQGIVADQVLDGHADTALVINFEVTRMIHEVARAYKHYVTNREIKA